MKRSRPLLSFALAAASTGAYANGLAINEQNASAMGTAFAGRASSALDASTLYGNPAGMSRLTRREVSGGLALIDADSSIEGDPRNTADGTLDGDMVPNIRVPFGFVTTPLNERWHAGFGIYVPFGLLDDYEDSFVGRYYAQRSSVRVVTLQPTLSYRINDRVSVGFGPTINRIDGELTNDLNFVVSDAEVKIEGDDMGYGYTLGVLVDVTPALAWGLTYRSKVDYTLKGHTRVSGVPALVPGLDALNGRYRASLDFTTPESVDSSISWQVSPRWTLHAGTTWTRWSRLESIRVENDGVPLPLFATVEEDMDWRDTWAYAIGAAYQLDERWVLRGGLAFDESPTRDAVRTARVPVADRRVLALGFGWSPTPELTVDVAYAYIDEKDARVSQAPTTVSLGGPTLDLQPGYYAEYDNRIQVLSAQLTYRF